MSGIDLQRSELDLARIVEAVLQIAQGRVNCAGEVTLRENQTTTVVDKDVDGCRAAVNVSEDSKVFLTPHTANAAGTLLNVYVSSRGQGTFTLTHSSLPSTDRTFGWVALG